MAVTSFNDRLQATGFEVTEGTNDVIRKKYRFYGDGSVKHSEDELDETFDRIYQYDHQGRTVAAAAGTDARGETSTEPGNLDRPYYLTYEFNAFGKITEIDGHYYNTAHTNTDYFTPSTGRNGGWGYDAAGNVTLDDDATYEYNAAGQLIVTNERKIDSETEFYDPIESYFDGDGKLVKRVRYAGSPGTPEEKTETFIRSNALGKIVSEATETGAKRKTFVFANGTVLAEQEILIVSESPVERLRFFHQDPAGAEVQQTESDGDVVLVDGYYRTAELDPLGRNVARPAQYLTLNSVPPETEHDGTGSMFGMSSGYRPDTGDYAIDNIPVPESAFFVELNSGLRGGIMGLVSGSNIVFSHWSDRVHEDVEYLVRNWLEFPIPNQLFGAQRRSEPGRVEESVVDDGEISEACINLIKGRLSEKVWNQILRLLESPPLIDLEATYLENYLPNLDPRATSGSVPPGNWGPLSVGAQPGYLFFPTEALKGETVGDVFSRVIAQMGGKVLTYRAFSGLLGSIVSQGIFFRGSEIDPRRDRILLLHEILHIVWPPNESLDPNLGTQDFDLQLVGALGIISREGETDSQAITRFLKNRCTDPVVPDAPL